MTRREEIVTATLGCRQSYADLKRPITPDDVADAFEKGAYWADKTMIDKACEILENVTVTYNKRFFGKCEENAFDDDFIKEFRKEMEE